MCLFMKQTKGDQGMEGSKVFEEQAEPVEAEIPFSFKDKSNDSPSMPSNLKCALLASRALGWPFKCALGIWARTLSMSSSR